MYNQKHLHSSFMYFFYSTSLHVFLFTNIQPLSVYFRSAHGAILSANCHCLCSISHELSLPGVSLYVAEAETIIILLLLPLLFYFGHEKFLKTILNNIKLIDVFLLLFKILQYQICVRLSNYMQTYPKNKLEHESVYL